MGHSWPLLGRPWLLLGCSCGALGPLLAVLGVLSAGPGALLAVLGALSAGPGALESLRAYVCRGLEAENGKRIRQVSEQSNGNFVIYIYIYIYIYIMASWKCLESYFVFKKITIFQTLVPNNAIESGAGR